MTYQEHFEFIKDKRWKVSDCFSGKDCWCRPITIEDEVGDEDIDFVIKSAAISKYEAEYIVQLHNENLEKNSKKKFGIE